MLGLKISVFIVLLISSGFSLMSYVPKWANSSQKKQRYIQKYGAVLGVFIHMVIHVFLPIILGVALLLKPS